MTDESTNDTDEEESHKCRHHIEWEPEGANPSEAVQGKCTECGTEFEHYCDETRGTSTLDDLTPDHSADWDQGAVFSLDYDCQRCGRSLTWCVRVEGTYDESGQQVYSG